MSTKPALICPNLPFARLSEDEGRLRAVIVLPTADEGMNIGGIFASMSAMSVAAVTDDFASGQASGFVDEREHHTPVLVAAYFVEIHHCLDALSPEQLFKVRGKRGVMEIRSAALASLHVEGDDWGKRLRRGGGRKILKGKLSCALIGKELLRGVMVPALILMVADPHEVWELYLALFIDVASETLRSPALGTRVAGGTACVLLKVETIITHGGGGLAFQISRLSKISKMELWKTHFPDFPKFPKWNSGKRFLEAV